MKEKPIRIKVVFTSCLETFFVSPLSFSFNAPESLFFGKTDMLTQKKKKGKVP